MDDTRATLESGVANLTACPGTTAPVESRGVAMSCMEPPGVTMPAPGVTSTNATGDWTTLIVAIAVLPSIEQVATVVPARWPVMTPFDPTDATLSSPIVQLRVDETTTPRESSAVQVRGVVTPSSTAASGGVI